MVRVKQLNPVLKRNEVVSRSIEVLCHHDTSHPSRNCRKVRCCQPELLRETISVPLVNA